MVSGFEIIECGNFYPYRCHRRYILIGQWNHKIKYAHKSSVQVPTISIYLMLKLQGGYRESHQKFIGPQNINKIEFHRRICCDTRIYLAKTNMCAQSHFVLRPSKKEGASANKTCKLNLSKTNEHFGYQTM